MPAKKEAPGIQDTLKKGVLAGLGAIDLSIEKAKEAIAKLVERGEISTEQGKKFLDELVERGRKDSADISKRIEDNVHRALERVSFASKSAVEALEARVAELERKVEELSARHRS